MENIGLEHEIIVVGAGPAGSTAALLLKRLGHDVLLVDKESFPRDKVCGDAIPAESVDKLREFGLGEKIDQLTKKGGLNPIQRSIIVSPRGKYFEFLPPHNNATALSYICPRKMFDAMLWQAATDEGVDFLQTEVIEPIINKDFINGVVLKHKGSKKNIKCKMVIGADGVSSAITRNIRNNKHTARHGCMAIRGYIEGINLTTNQIESYFNKDFLPGYAWIFPVKKGLANVGVGVRHDRYRERNLSLDELLNKFISMPAIKNRLNGDWRLRDVAPWKLNFGSQKYLQHTFNGALLLGDAAGIVNPFMGDGINNALLSAELAANTTHTALENDDISREGLMNYENVLNAILYRNMRRQYTRQRLFYEIPYLIDFLGLGKDWRRIKNKRLVCNTRA